MRPDIAREVFDTGDPAQLRKLIALAIEGRHDWRPEADDAIYAEERRDRLPQDQHEFLAKVVEEASNPAPDSVAGVARVTLAELDIVNDLAKPAVLVLENRFGDGEFVQRVAAVFGQDRIIEALKPRNDWLRLCNGGGIGQLAESAIAECKVFQVLARVAVLLDSDRAHAGAVSPNEKIVARMRAAGVREVHMLLLRMMENYLPMKVWEHHFARHRHRAVRFVALREVAAEDRRYMHLKKHFVGDKQMPKPLLPETLVLSEADFDELGDEAVADLRKLFAMIYRVL